MVQFEPPDKVKDLIGPGERVLHITKKKGVEMGFPEEVVEQAWSRTGGHGEAS